MNAEAARRRGPGRPRSEEARAAIVAATSDLLDEGGYGAATMEAIARRAGVSKQTVYRWWPNRAAVVLELLNEKAARIAPPRLADNLDDDLRAFVRRSVAGVGPNARILAGLMAEAQLDAASSEAFRTEFLARRREVLVALLERARNRGELRPDADVRLLVDIMFGTLWYRLLAAHAPLNRRFADQLASALLELAR